MSGSIEAYIKMIICRIGIILLLLPIATLAQSRSPSGSGLLVQEADSVPRKQGIDIIEVTNGSLTIQGRKAIIATGGSTVPAGSGSELQYRASSSSFGALSSSSVSGANLSLGGVLNLAAIAAPGSPADGDLWRDSTQKSLSFRENSLTSQIPRLIFVQTATAQVVNTTTETTLLGSGSGTKTLPANTLNVVGKVIHLRADGLISSTTVPGTITVRVKLGATTILASAATTFVGSLTNEHWRVDVYLVTRTTGASGTVIGQTSFIFGDGTAIQARAIKIIATAPVTVDLSAGFAPDLTFQWGTASAANDVRCTNSILSILN